MKKLSLSFLLVNAVFCGSLWASYRDDETEGDKIAILLSLGVDPSHVSATLGMLEAVPTDQWSKTLAEFGLMTLSPCDADDRGRSSSSSSAPSSHGMGSDDLAAIVRAYGIADEYRAFALSVIRSVAPHEREQALLTVGLIHDRRPGGFDDRYDPSASVPRQRLDPEVRQAISNFAAVLNSPSIQDGMDVHGFNGVIRPSVHGLLGVDRTHCLTDGTMAYGVIVAALGAHTGMVGAPLTTGIAQLNGYIQSGTTEAEIAVPLPELLSRSYDAATKADARGALFSVHGVAGQMTAVQYLAYKVAENVTGAGGCVQGHAGRLAHVYLQLMGLLADLNGLYPKN